VERVNTEVSDYDLRLLVAIAALAFVAIFVLTRAKSPGQVAAESWLALVDSGHYDQSWDHTSEYFKSRVARADWIDNLGRDRRIGRARSRRLMSAQYIPCPAEFPFGHCMRIRYHVSYEKLLSGEKLPSGIETVGVLKENGQWRVSGYFLDTEP
jgi:hypothetical protein